MYHPSPSKLVEESKEVSDLQHLAVFIFVFGTLWALLGLFWKAIGPIGFCICVATTFIGVGVAFKFILDIEDAHRGYKREYERYFFSKTWTLPEIRETLMLLESHLNEFEELPSRLEYSRALSRGLVDLKVKVAYKIEFLKAKLKDPNTRLDQLNTLNREQAKQIRLNPELKAQIEGLFNQRKLELLTEDE